MNSFSQRLIFNFLGMVNQAWLHIVIKFTLNTIGQIITL